MNFFQLKEYWRYRRAAMGRHGVHSPAVYRFIEDGLRPTENTFAGASPYKSTDGRLWQPHPLMRRIAHHFRFEEILVPSENSGELQSYKVSIDPDHPSSVDRYHRLFDWGSLPPETWAEHLEDGTGARDVVAIHHIHHSPDYVSAWNVLRAQPKVRLSLDLFRVGLLFFGPEFRERQHFVLKYPH